MERKRERERDTERERYSYLFFMCVCVCVCACASSGVFVSLNIALSARCVHTQREALLCEVKRKLSSLLEGKEKEDSLSLDITLCLVNKNRGKHLKKRTHEKRQERKSSFFWWWFFLRSFPLSKSVSFCSHDPSLSKKGIINL